MAERRVDKGAAQRFVRAALVEEGGPGDLYF